MKTGSVLKDRFELEALAATGGMGKVYRALDRTSGQTVALKVVPAHTEVEAARFAREAKVLAGLSHPGIVGYLAHDVAEPGQLYLAMEWLSGEDLAGRLGRGRLSVSESVTLGRRVAEALGAAHARGVVHRDLKPSNIFLPDSDLARAKILDFGIACLDGGTRVTGSQTIVGTPGYMAPEQARTSRELDARVDVFSLGSVLFECLTGAPAFQGSHFMAVLAKILFEESPRLRSLRPDVPRALDALVARMLSKDPDARPKDGAAVAEALAALDMTPDEGAPRPSAKAASLTTGERRAVSLVVLSAERGDGEGAVGTGEAEEEKRRVAADFGGRLELLADGSAVVVFAGAGVPTDQAVQATRCALVLREHAPDQPIALATERADATAQVPVGAAIDRAATMLAVRTEKRLLTRRAEGADGSPPITLDEVTAGLLDARFDVRSLGGKFVLVGERELFKETRTLLGKPTPCVGRDLELRVLEQMCVHSMESPAAQAALVTAPAGTGKSRLAFELIHRLRQRGEVLSIWVARGDSLRSGAPFGLLGQAIRSAFGIQEGEPLEERRSKLEASVAERIGEAERRRVTEFLGEIIGTPMPDDDSMPLRAARRDAQLMGAQIAQAWLDLVLGETARCPLLLVLEDLHWSDLPTVRAIDAALGALESRPFAVLALARPEVGELFPHLWGDRGVQEIRLRTLSVKASEKLVRQVLGEDVDPAMLDRVVKLSEGNAFYLEELIRAAHERQALPETVVAMVQSRLSALDDGLRRLLRAASIFGEVFWDGGVARLLGEGERSAPAVTDRLGELVRRELIVRRPVSRFPGEGEYAFRHALLREGAYAMLTDVDRRLGHGLAGAWLESGPGASADRYGVLGDHFMRAEQWDKAIDYLHRAGDAAMAVFAYLEARAHYDRVLESLSSLPITEENRRRHIDIVLRYSEASWLTDAGKGLERLDEAARLAGALPDRDRRSALARVRMSLGRFHTVRCNYAVALDLLRQALSDAVALNEERVAALTQLTIVQVDVMQGRWGRAVDEVRAVIEPLRRNDDWMSWITAVGDLALSLALQGRYGEGLRELASVMPRAEELQSPGAITMASTYTLYTYFMAWDMPAIARTARVVVELAQRSGEMMLVWVGAWMGGWAKANLGDHEGAARDAERAHALLEQLGGRLFIADWFLAFEAGRVLLAGRPAEAVALAEKAIAYARGFDGLHGVALARRFSGQALAALDPPRWDEAEAHLAESSQLFSAGDATMEIARTERAWAQVCAARGDREGARAHFNRAMELFEASDLAGELESTKALAGVL